MPDVDKIVQLSDFYGVTTDEILKGEAAATQQDGSPEAQSAGNGDDGQTEAGAEDAAGDAVPGDGQETSGAARFAAAAAQAVPSASAVFLRVWPAFCAIVCILSLIHILFSNPADCAIHLDFLHNWKSEKTISC